MSAVAAVSRAPRRARVPGRVLVPWILGAFGCFVMALGLGVAPPPADPVAGTLPAIEASVALGLNSPNRVDTAEAAAPTSVPGSTPAKATAGSSALKTLAILAFLAALLAAVTGNYRGYALNGD